MNIFVDLYLDEDVDVLIARLIRAWGFDARTTVEAGNLGKSDLEQLAYASEHHRALVTHNRVDFERLADAYFANEQNHGGIVIAVRRYPREVAERLRQVLDRFTADELENQLVYL